MTEQTPQASSPDRQLPPERQGTTRKGPIGVYEAGTALIVVDLQNDFADPGGSLYVPGGESVVQIANSEIRAAEEAGALIVYTQDWHPASTPHFQKDGGIWPVHCVADTWGSELHPDLLVVDAPVVRKGANGSDGYSGFTVRDVKTQERKDTGLQKILEEAGVRRIIIVGLAQDYCVKETALDAARLGYETHVLGDATQPVNLSPGDGARAVAELTDAGVNVR